MLPRANKAVLSLAYTYKKGVLYYNISISNLLLNKNLNIKLYNF